MVAEYLVALLNKKAFIILVISTQIKYNTRINPVIKTK